MEKKLARVLWIDWDKNVLLLGIQIDDWHGKTIPRFILVNDEEIAVTEFDIRTAMQNTFEVSLNITNSGINRCIDNGVYHLLITDEESFYTYLLFTGDTTILLKHNYCLRCDSDKKAYTVTFVVPEKVGEPVLNMIFQFMKNEEMRHIPTLGSDRNDIPFKSRKIVLRLKQKYYRCLRSLVKKNINLLYRFIHSFCRHNDRIAFVTDTSTELSLNLMCLSERLKERGLNEKYKLQYSLLDLPKIKGDPVKLIGFYFKRLIILACSEIILLDDSLEMLNWLIISPDQKVIQVWHSGAGFKCIGYARWGAMNSPSAFTCHRQYTYFVSDSEQLAGEWANLAGILREQVIPTGMPRLDRFLDEERREQFVKMFFLEHKDWNEKKIILFAPTYRGVRQADAFYPYERIDFDSLYSFCEKSGCIVLFKMHPFVTDKVPIKDEYRDLLFDFTSFKDINELFYITDLLITDYSSCMYEYSLMHKPMLAYAFDMQQYFSSHGCPRSYEDNIPGKVCRTFDELMDSLWKRDFQFEKHEQYLKKYFDRIDTGNTDRVIDWLILDGMPDDLREKLLLKKESINSLRGKSFKHLVSES